MKSKFFEIRDIGTKIPVLAIKTEGDTERESKFLWHCGWDKQTVILIKMSGEATAGYDAFAWDNARTMRTAHLYIQENFDALDNFAVIDVEYINGETKSPKASEIFKEDAE